jgi:hypothetical protein
MFMSKKKMVSSIGAAVILALIVVIAGSARDVCASNGGDAAAKAFPKGADCAACHKAYGDSMKDPRMLISKHAAMARDCTACHKEADMAKAHEKVASAPPGFFRQRKYPNDMCTACHGSYDGLVEKTKSSTAFKTTHGDLINPHKTHVGQVECYNCHKMHKDKPPIEYCYGCHHPRQLNNCKECHSPKKE